MSRDDPDLVPEPSRRSVLKGLAGSATLGAASATAAPAVARAARRGRPTPTDDRQQREARREIERQYESRDLRAALTTHTEGLRDALVEQRILLSADVSQFSLDLERALRVSGDDFAAVGDGVGLTSTFDEAAGRASAHLFAATELRGCQVHLHAEPEVSDSYAVMLLTEPYQVRSRHARSLAYAQNHFQPCRTECAHPTYGPVVLGTATQWECGEIYAATEEPSCEECPDRDGCGLSDGGGVVSAQ